MKLIHIDNPLDYQVCCQEWWPKGICTVHEAMSYVASIEAVANTAASDMAVFGTNKVELRDTDNTAKLPGAFPGLWFSNYC